MNSLGHGRKSRAQVEAARKLHAPSGVNREHRQRQPWLGLHDQPERDARPYEEGAGTAELSGTLGPASP